MPKRSLNRSSAACATSVLQDGAFGMGKSPKIWEDPGDLWGPLGTSGGFIADVLIVAGGLGHDFLMIVHLLELSSLLLSLF